MTASDLVECEAAIRNGSRSFWAASRLLPSSIRHPALALYAFCRMADDAVDEVARDQKSLAVLQMRDRLERAYAGRPKNTAADRAFADLITEYDMPRALPEALLEGFAWDGMERRYETLSEVRAYSARVASAVGAMMCVLMRIRDPDALARACDLGVAMQLTNIARDVGEDARAGRIYLPLEWFDDAGLDPETFLSAPHISDDMRRMVKQLLREADRLYQRATPGIEALPFAARPGIYAARHIYAGIGQAVARNGYDSIGSRARTTGMQKVGWLALSMTRSMLSTVLPASPCLYAAPLSEVAFLVEAAAEPKPQTGWSTTLLDIFAQLEARDRRMHHPRSHAS